MSGVKQWAQEPTTSPHERDSDPLSLDSNQVFISVARQDEEDVLRAKQIEIRKLEEIQGI